MNIPTSIIESYLLSKFRNYRINGREFLMDSIFVEDYKKHLSINLDTGLWQDFKASESGNFFQFISYVEGVSYDTATKFISSKLLSTPEKLFTCKLPLENKSLSKNTVPEIFKDFYKFDLKKLNPANLTHRLAYKFIKKRKLQKWPFYISEKGKFANRLIIPYMHNKTPFFFQGRNLSKCGVKYLNPSRLEGVKSSDILFPFNSTFDYVFVCEGPLDAISLQLNGYNATSTQGSNLSFEQVKQLKDKKIILAYDSDEPGIKGIEKAVKVLLKKNTNNFYVSTIPEGYKDWNEVHVKLTKDEFSKKILKSIKKIDLNYIVSNKLG